MLAVFHAVVLKLISTITIILIILRQALTPSTCSMWSRLLTQVSYQFGQKTKRDLMKNEILLRYHPTKNSIRIDDHGKCDMVLNKSTIEIYCNLLRSSKDCQTMYFYFGDLPEDHLKKLSKDSKHKSVSIISPQLGNKLNNYNCHRIVTFSNENKNDLDAIDWDNNYMQLILFLNKIYNINNGDYTDYTNWNYYKYPLTICMIEPDHLDAIMTRAIAGPFEGENFDLESHDMEVECNERLQDCFDEYYVFGDDYDCGGNHCGIYVCYKNYLFISQANMDINNHVRLYWVPGNYYLDPHNYNDNIDWKKEFSQLTARVCKQFGLINDNKLSIVYEDDNVENGDDLSLAWDEVLDDYDCFGLGKLTVTGQV